MPQSLSWIVVHLVFSTKGRVPSINETARPDLHAYLASVVRNSGCECYRVGGTEDHIHMAIRVTRTVTIAKLVEELKSSSSRWMKTQDPSLATFAWQTGYGAFSIAKGDLERLRIYIDNQEEHHKKFSFQDEYRRILQDYDVPFDEAYVWD